MTAIEITCVYSAIQLKKKGNSIETKCEQLDCLGNQVVIAGFKCKCLAYQWVWMAGTVSAKQLQGL